MLIYLYKCINYYYYYYFKHEKIIRILENKIDLEFQKEFRDL